MAYKVDTKTRLAIRELYNERGYTLKEIASMFGVSKTTVWMHTREDEEIQLLLEDRKTKYREGVADENGFKTYKAYKEAQRRRGERRLEKVLQAINLQLGACPIGAKTRFAKKAGISRQLLHHYLTRKYPPKRDKLKRIVNALDIPEEEKKILTAS